MKVKWGLTRRLYQQAWQKEDIAPLYKFIDGSIALPEELEIRYNERIQQLEEEHDMAYITSMERMGIKKGYQQGVAQGIEKGEYLFLLRLLERKFGEIPAHYQQRMNKAHAEMLLSWGEKVLGATSLEEVFS